MAFKTWTDKLPDGRIITHLANGGYTVTPAPVKTGDMILVTVNADATLLVQVWSAQCRCFEIAGWGIFVAWLDARYNQLPIHVRGL